MVTLTLEGTAWFPKQLHHFQFLPAKFGDFSTPHPCPNLLLSVFLSVVLICITNDNDQEPLFMCLLVFLNISSLGKCPFNNFAQL
jgi:hypothetical protein